MLKKKASSFALSVVKRYTFKNDFYELPVSMNNKSIRIVIV